MMKKQFNHLSFLLLLLLCSCSDSSEEQAQTVREAIQLLDGLWEVQSIQGWEDVEGLKIDISSYPTDNNQQYFCFETSYDRAFYLYRINTSDMNYFLCMAYHYPLIECYSILNGEAMYFNIKYISTTKLVIELSGNYFSEHYFEKKITFKKVNRDKDKYTLEDLKGNWRQVAVRSGQFDDKGKKLGVDHIYKGGDTGFTFNDNTYSNKSLPGTSWNIKTSETVSMSWCMTYDFLGIRIYGEPELETYFIEQLTPERLVLQQITDDRYTFYEFKKYDPI